MFGVDDLLMGGLNLIGGWMKNDADDKRQDKTNEFNAAEGEKTRNFNADQANINREYQERLSNTAYQRSMNDMARAGLNPILAYQKGGASSPTGATASTGIVSGAAPKEATNIIGQAASSALGARRANQELENMKIQNDLTRSQTAQSLSATTLNNETAKKAEAEKNIRLQELSPAKRNAVEADIERDVLQNSAGRLAKQTGFSAGLVKPAVDTISSAVKAATPFASRFHF